jgi:hypothetical protein
VFVNGGTRSIPAGSSGEEARSAMIEEADNEANALFLTKTVLQEALNELIGREFLCCGQ